MALTINTLAGSVLLQNDSSKAETLTTTGRRCTFSISVKARPCTTTALA